MFPLFLTAVIVAPIAEELFFRGIVLRGYLRRYTAAKAIWTSAILFALFHLNPWQAVVALPLGVWYAWMVLRTGSLLPGMLSHAMVNFSTTFLLGPLVLALGFTTEEVKSMRNYPPSMLLVGASMAMIGGFIHWRQIAGIPLPTAAVAPDNADVLSAATQGVADAAMSPIGTTEIGETPDLLTSP